MLLVHGLIHLLGYYPETGRDYEAMVELEEKVLAAVFIDTLETTAAAVAAPASASVTGSAGATGSRGE